MDDQTLDAIKDRILASFPLESRWYDCRNDTTGTVVLHFNPRGLVLREHSGDLVRYSYSQLLAGQLIEPTNKPLKAFDAYRDRLRRVDQEYTAALAAAGLDTTVWDDA